MHNTLLKICGITNLDDASLCLDLGADMLGVILDPSISRHGNRTLIDQIREIGGLACAVYTDKRQFYGEVLNEDISQLHFLFNEDDMAYCHSMGKKVMAVASTSFVTGVEERVMQLRSMNPDEILLDFRDGASGHASEINRIFSSGRTGLAGKIDINNIMKIMETRPSLIDVSSSLESYPGKKDKEKTRMFMERAGELIAGLA